MARGGRAEAIWRGRARREDLWRGPALAADGICWSGEHAEEIWARRSECAELILDCDGMNLERNREGGGG